MSRAILIATAGTSSQEASDVFCRFDKRLAGRFGDCALYWAYTSRGVRRKLAGRGSSVDDPEQALRRIRNDGVTHVAVKSLHMAPGMEYTELQEAVNDAAGFERVVLDRPLLESSSRAETLLKALVASLPELGPDDGVLFAAHGSRRAAAQGAYEQASAVCARLDRRVFMGTMIPPSNREAMVQTCLDAGVRRLHLVPFMIAAGFSAFNEVAGPDEASWQSAIEAAGMECCPVLRGLGDYEDVVDIWLDQISGLLREME